MNEKKSLRAKKGEAIASLQRNTLYSATGMREQTGVPLATTVDALTRLKDSHPLRCTKEYVDAKPMYAVPDTFTAEGYVKWSESKMTKLKDKVKARVSSSMPLDDYSKEVVVAVEALTALAKRNAELERAIKKLKGALADV